ncbi:glucosamine-6-phosphate deaminase [bacterium]|nr:glucosamine-6-phosphate deaminase [bacterium]
MEVIVKENYDKMSRLAAKIIAEVVREKPRAVLGLATGSTPMGTYKELIRLHKEEGLDFSQVVTFNLDEYIGLPPEHEQSYHYFMKENFFDHINIPPGNIHLPPGMVENLLEACRQYEQDIKDAGGIDIQLLGIGVNGHIAFNEPGSSLGSRTRVKTLDNNTIQNNSRFFERIEDVPKYAITMGIGTVMNSQRLLLLATGVNKAHAIAITVEGPITALVPATIVQLHRQATLVVDRQAAAELKCSYRDSPHDLSEAVAYIKRQKGKKS